jgi:hypothetical protein
MSYMYEVTRQKLTLGANAEILKNDTRTYEITPLEGGDYRKLIKIDGKPLSDLATRQEEAKLEENFKKRSRISRSERTALEKKKTERCRKEEQFWNEALKAFDFEEVGIQTIGGRPARMFKAVPRPQYIPAAHDFELFKKITGKIWIDTADDQVSRAEVKFVEDIRFGGGFLARVNKGGTFTVLQRKVNDEVWFPVHCEVAVNGRIALFKGFNLKIISDFANYRKFQTSVDFIPDPSTGR